MRQATPPGRPQRREPTARGRVACPVCGRDARERDEDGELAVVCQLCGPFPVRRSLVRTEQRRG